MYFWISDRYVVFGKIVGYDHDFLIYFIDFLSQNIILTVLLSKIVKL